MARFSLILALLAALALGASASPAAVGHKMGIEKASRFFHYIKSHAETLKNRAASRESIDDLIDETKEKAEEGARELQDMVNGNDDGKCFPADATVTLHTGEKRRMDALSVGDIVHVGAGIYSTVFMFTHKTASYTSTYIQLTTASGFVLRATPGHFIHANSRLVAAAHIAVGDKLVRASDGSADAVVHVASVAGTGLYNPQTLHGDVAVNGVVASTYTRAVEPSLAHAALAPARAVWKAFGWYSSALEGGSRLAGAVPASGAVF